MPGSALMRTRLLPGNAAAGRIPTVLHQTYPTVQLPQELGALVEGNLAQLPGWEHRLYDDDDIVELIRLHYGGELLLAYQRLSPEYGAARADFFRYLLIHAVGGVYLDIKAAVTRPLDAVIRSDDECLIGQWRDCGEPKYEAWGQHPEMAAVGGELQQWFLIARPGHPYFKRVIDRMLQRMRWYLPSLHGVGKYGVVRTTGPVMFTQAILPVLDQWPHRRIRSFTDLGLRYSGFPERDSHFAAFDKGHYTRKSSPITAMSVPMRSVDVLLGGMISVRNRFRR